jgi:hypothetical protein
MISFSAFEDFKALDCGMDYKESVFWSLIPINIRLHQGPNKVILISRFDFRLKPIFTTEQAATKKY